MKGSDMIKDTGDRDLEEWLTAYSVPPHRDNLTQDICAQAAHIPQKKTRMQQLQDKLHDWRANILVPAGAFAIALLLLAGFVGGYGLSYSPLADDVIFYETNTLDVFFKEEPWL